MQNQLTVRDDVVLVDERDRLSSVEKSYPRRMDLDGEKYAPSSAIGVVVDGKPEILITASGGATALHTKSHLVVEDRLYLAIGEYVVCLTLPELRVAFSEKMDDATCFALLHDESSGAFLVHGELLITRFTGDGKILWQSGGADVFSEGCEIIGQSVRVTDFNGHTYLFNLETGAVEKSTAL